MLWFYIQDSAFFLNHSIIGIMITVLIKFWIKGESQTARGSTHCRRGENPLPGVSRNSPAYSPKRRTYRRRKEGGVHVLIMNEKGLRERHDHSALMLHRRGWEMGSSSVHILAQEFTIQQHKRCKNGTRTKFRWMLDNYYTMVNFKVIIECWKNNIIFTKTVFESQI